MGLAASQARLLSLTVRQHSVEGRAQYLQAQKLRLANDSDAVYQKYINALDATRLQTKTYDSSGKVQWIDGSFNNLTKYTHDDKANGNVYYVQDINDGLLYQPLRICDAYNNAAGDLFAFLDSMGVSYEKDAHTDDYINAEALVNEDIAKGWNVIPYDKTFLDRYNELKVEIKYPSATNTYKNANYINSLLYLAYNSNNYEIYTPTTSNQYTELKTYLNELKNSSYYTNSDNKKLIDYCLNFNIPSIFDNPSNVNTLTAKNLNGSVQYITYDKSTEESIDNEDERQQVDDKFKLSMLLNGGSYKLNNGAETNIYDDATKTFLSSYTGWNNASIGDALFVLTENILAEENEKAIATAQSDLETLLTSNGLDKNTVETTLSNFEKYNEHLNNLLAQNQETFTKYLDVEIGKYYENLFYAIQTAGGCKEISDTNAKSATWVNNMIKNTQVVLGIYNEESKEFESISASTNTGLREVTNDEEIILADSEYETELQEIDSKEKKYQIELNQLEAERNSIKTEIDALKQIAKENIEKTFTTFT